MPAVVEALDPVEELPVEPGREAVARFSVRNTGDDVNNFTFRVLGEPSLWRTGIRVVGDPGGEKQPSDAPPELDLFPNEKREVEVTFRPPQSSGTAPGLVPYELLVCSYAARNDQREEDIEAVEEGLLNVASFAEREAQLIPRTSRGRHHGRHRLAVDNLGNSPAIATFAAEDSENFLQVRFRPRTLVVAPGTAGFTKVKVKPRRLFVLGPPRAAPFKVHVTFAAGEAGREPAAPEQIPPVDGLYMQRAVVPTVLLPIGVIVAAAVILWAILRPQPDATAAGLGAAQQAAATQSIAVNANALTRHAIKTAHADAVQARKQAQKDAAAGRKQAAQVATAARNDAKKTETQATAASAVAAKAGTRATNAARTATKALQAATPAFTGAPYAQQLTPALTTQPFPAHTLYVTDVIVGNPGAGKGTLTLTLGGASVLVEPLAAAGAELKLATPLLVSRNESLVTRVSCAQGPCTPSVFVSGFAPAKAPDPTGRDGVPSWKRLSPTCAACSVLTVPQTAKSYEITDVVFQNPAADTATMTLSRAGRPLLAEGIDASRPGDLPLSLTAPIALQGGERLTLTVRCRNPGGKRCTAGALLNGVLRAKK
jgi:hypothetical protein